MLNVIVTDTEKDIIYAIEYITNFGNQNLNIGINNDEMFKSFSQQPIKSTECGKKGLKRKLSEPNLLELLNTYKKQLTPLTHSELNIDSEIPDINTDEVIFNEASLEIELLESYESQQKQPSVDEQNVDKENIQPPIKRKYRKKSVSESKENLSTKYELRVRSNTQKTSMAKSISEDKYTSDDKLIDRKKNPLAKNRSARKK